MRTRPPRLASLICVAALTLVGCSSSDADSDVDSDADSDAVQGAGADDGSDSVPATRAAIEATLEAGTGRFVSTSTADSVVMTETTASYDLPTLETELEMIGPDGESAMRMTRVDKRAYFTVPAAGGPLSKCYAVITGDVAGPLAAVVNRGSAPAQVQMLATVQDLQPDGAATIGLYMGLYAVAPNVAQELTPAEVRGRLPVVVSMADELVDTVRIDGSDLFTALRDAQVGSPAGMDLTLLDEIDTSIVYTDVGGDVAIEPPTDLPVVAFDDVAESPDCS